MRIYDNLPIFPKYFQKPKSVSELADYRTSTEEQLGRLDDEMVELRITNEQLQNELQEMQEQYDEVKRGTLLHSFAVLVNRENNFSGAV